MKKLTDIYLVNRLKELLIYQKVFKEFLKEFNEKEKQLKEKGEEPIKENIEEDSFKLLVLMEDGKKVAMEIEIIVELYRKTKQELPKEYEEITSKIEGFKEEKRSNLFTFVVDGDKLAEREKGLLKNRLKLTKASETYQYFNKVNDRRA